MEGKALDNGGTTYVISGFVTALWTNRDTDLISTAWDESPMSDRVSEIVYDILSPLTCTFLGAGIRPRCLSAGADTTAIDKDEGVLT